MEYLGTEIIDDMGMLTIPVEIRELYNIDESSVVLLEGFGKIVYPHFHRVRKIPPSSYSGWVDEHGMFKVPEKVMREQGWSIGQSITFRHNNHGLTLK
jgi:bifunctional DNA-binding transcriptional regulator/antitoxin component of YhaV-PrlF toxin-antitoxin module